ncbi:MAG: hypothetical protein WB392_08465 [Methanotrichaceae archaeon]
MVWIKGSGLSPLRAILLSQRNQSSLSQEDLELAKLWARTDNNHSGLSEMVIAVWKEICEA